MINVAVDGPAGAGKSTVSRRAAKILGLVYVDTGALYRAIGLYVIEKGIDTKDEKAVTSVLKDITVDLDNSDGEQRVLLCGEDVTGNIRTGAVSMAASDVSSYSEVRAFLLETQKKIAREKSVIMDGRDIGTVVLPDADVKVFLTADAAVRAKRRFLELTERKEKVDYNTILAEINERDHNDKNRAVAPLKQADDAILLDTSKMSFDESIQALVNIIRKGTDIK